MIFYKDYGKGNFHLTMISILGGVSYLLGVLFIYLGVSGEEDLGPMLVATIICAGAGFGLNKLAEHLFEKKLDTQTQQPAQQVVNQPVPVVQQPIVQQPVQPSIEIAKPVPIQQPVEQQVVNQPVAPVPIQPAQQAAPVIQQPVEQPVQTGPSVIVEVEDEEEDEEIIEVTFGTVKKPTTKKSTTKKTTTKKTTTKKTTTRKKNDE